MTQRNKAVAQILPCQDSPVKRTRLGFDPGVRILGSLIEPALDGSEWGISLSDELDVGRKGGEPLR